MQHLAMLPGTQGSDRAEGGAMDEDGREVLQLQGLRLMRAFLRIADAAQRQLVIALAERLADEPSSGTADIVPMRADGPSGEAPRDLTT
jgi:hypothetical protein